VGDDEQRHRDRDRGDDDRADDEADPSAALERRGRARRAGRAIRKRDVRGHRPRADAARQPARRQRSPLVRRQRGGREVERVRHRRRAQEAVVGLLGERREDHVLERGRQLGPERARRPRRLLEVGAHQIEQRLADERLAPGRELVQDDAGGVEVGPRIDAARAADLLGRHVLRGPEQRAGAGPRRQLLVELGRELGDPEVEDLGVAFEGDEDVVGLEVAMHDADRVRRGERREHLAHDLDQAAERHRARLRDRGERLALDVLHHDERPAVGQLRHVDDADDALVADQIDRAPLGEEPLEQLGVPRALIRQDLDRHAAADRRLHREVDAAHAALAEQARQPVTADLGAEQRIVGVDQPVAVVRAVAGGGVALPALVTDEGRPRGGDHGYPCSRGSAAGASRRARSRPWHVPIARN